MGTLILISPAFTKSGEIKSHSSISLWVTEGLWSNSISIRCSCYFETCFDALQYFMFLHVYWGHTTEHMSFCGVDMSQTCVFVQSCIHMFTCAVLNLHLVNLPVPELPQSLSDAWRYQCSLQFAWICVVSSIVQASEIRSILDAENFP